MTPQQPLTREKLIADLRTIVRGVGALSRFGLYLAAGLLAYHYMPSVADKPIGALTVNEVLGLVCLPLFIIGLIKSFFDGTSHDNEWWGFVALGVVVVGGSFLLFSDWRAVAGFWLLCFIVGACIAGIVRDVKRRNTPKQ